MKVPLASNVFSCKSSCIIYTLLQLITRKDLLKSMKNVDRSELHFHDISESTDTEKKLLLTDSTPLVYICATMWHENEQEMIYMLKSIFRYHQWNQCY